MSPTIHYSLGGVDFEWDADKALTNLTRHRVSFEAAASSLLDPDASVTDDEPHSAIEARWRCMGRSTFGVLVATAYTLRDQRYRLISARPATKRERHEYERSLR